VLWLSTRRLFASTLSVQVRREGGREAARRHKIKVYNLKIYIVVIGNGLAPTSR